jgi:hypothetical protein
MTNDLIANENYVSAFRRKIWITKGTRFNAHHRIMCKHTYSSATLAFCSTYVLLVSILGYLPLNSLNAFKHDVLSFSAIGLSIFILALSLLEASKSYQINAKAFHECGRKLSNLYDRFEILTNIEQPNLSQSEFTSQFKEMSREYDAILDQCQENHSSIDLKIFRLQHQDEFKTTYISRMAIMSEYYVLTFFPYLALIVIPPILVTVLCVF